MTENCSRLKIREGVSYEELEGQKRDLRSFTKTQKTDAGLNEKNAGCIPTPSLFSIIQLFNKRAIVQSNYFAFLKRVKKQLLIGEPHIKVAFLAFWIQFVNIFLEFSYDVIADTIRPGEDEVTIGDPSVTGIPTSIVNATAPEPSVILRIVDENGDDISGTRLGQALFIRIELVGDTIFDIFARNLVAKSGLDEEEIVLLDDRGCPADLVFPGLEKDPDTGALLGKFEAFKFSDTTVVNFEVNVQFCQDRCNPVSLEYFIYIVVPII